MADSLVKNSTLLQDKVKDLPLKQLKRMLAAAIYSSDTDAKLASLGEDPENLRKQLKHLIKSDKLFFESEKSFERPEIVEFLNRNVSATDKIIFVFDHNSWGDGWGGDWDTMTTTKLTYVIITVEDEKIKIRMLQTTAETFYMGGYEDEFHMKIYVPKVSYSLYEMIALHPKLIERLVLIIGSYEELLKLLQ